MEMNAVAQGGDQRVNECDMTGQCARTHCAKPEECHAAFNLKNYSTNAQMFLISSQEYSLKLEFIKHGVTDVLTHVYKVLNKYKC